MLRAKGKKQNLKVCPRCGKPVDDMEESRVRRCLSEYLRQVTPRLPTQAALGMLHRDCISEDEWRQICDRLGGDLNDVELSALRFLADHGPTVRKVLWKEIGVDPSKVFGAWTGFNPRGLLWLGLVECTGWGPGGKSGHKVLWYQITDRGRWVLA